MRVQRRRRSRSLAAALLFLGSAFPSQAVAAEAERRLQLRSASRCPDAETLRAALGPLLPGWSIDVANESESESGDHEHRASWDERGLRFDGSLVKKRGDEGGCRRVAENWAVTLALLAESPEAMVVLEESSGESVEASPSASDAPEESAAPEVKEPTGERKLLLGGLGGLFVPLESRGAIRGFGELDAQALWESWGVRLALGATSIERLRVDGGPAGLIVAAAQTWIALGVVAEVPLSFATVRGTLGPLLALDHVEGSGIDRGFRNSAPNIGVDVGVAARFPVGVAWFWLVSVEGAFFPSPSFLAVRNATTSEELSLGRLPVVLPRFGVGFGRSFGW